MKKLVCLFLVLFLAPSLSYAWWNKDWSYRKKISIDVQKLQQDGVKVPGESLMLVRLHTGNFGFFADLAEKGKDLRFTSADDKTPLKYYIEQIDPVNELAQVWVRLPKEIADEKEAAIWMYYGNKKAVDGQEPTLIFDEQQLLAFHFEPGPVKDATAYGINPTSATNTNAEGGAIGYAAVFDGNQSVKVSGNPATKVMADPGWTLSTWVKIDKSQTDGIVFQLDKLVLSIRGQSPVLKVGGQEFVSPAGLNLAAWQSLAVTANTSGFTLYVDGKAVGNLPAAAAVLAGELSIGAALDGSRGLVGGIDELGLHKIPRDQNSLHFASLMQGQASALLTYGEDSTPDSEEGGESYVMATLNNVTIDGWVIIGILGVMFLISWLVMFVKAIVLSKTHRINQKFEKAFATLGAENIKSLDQPSVAGEEDFEESPLLLSLTGNHSTYAGSSIYRIYHVGVQEMEKRLAKADTGPCAKLLTAQSLNAVKASMDGVMVREMQKLNSLMVLLTIAISGGPFLGLLGTVVGVMITFAAIAVSGEVNVNAIAPGIAAALTATVAGLAVAIPALFGYNYLGSRIKVITADMQVFVDEFIAKLAEQHS
jgi:biopolymer transport protein ExbB